jgi:hypothetical protein
MRHPKANRRTAIFFIVLVAIGLAATTYFSEHNRNKREFKKIFAVSAPENEREELVVRPKVEEKILELKIECATAYAPSKFVDGKYHGRFWPEDPDGKPLPKEEGQNYLVEKAKEVQNRRLAASLALQSAEYLAHYFKVKTPNTEAGE